MGETETINPRYRGLDTWSDADILDALWEGQARAVACVHKALPAISAAAIAMAERLGGSAGRIVYAGCGTSGRQAALDGMELGATFSWPDARVAFVLAEGQLLTPESARGGFEDDEDAARSAIGALKLGAADVLIAVSASGSTPYTCAAAEAAAAAGALVVAMAREAGSRLVRSASHAILLATGAEVIAGSTRMNAGTAQSSALGLLSSLAMTRLGQVHDGLMVGVRIDSAKLAQRAEDIVRAIAGCSEEVAAEALAATGGRVKPAVLVALGSAPAEAEALLKEAGGNLRLALRQRSCSD